MRRLATLFLISVCGLPAIFGIVRQQSVDAAPATAQIRSFDRLNDQDRERFAIRFKQEIWPLLLRNKKDGCVGCHHAKGRTDLRFSGKPAADFRMLLREGFFLVDDSGSILHLVSSKSRRERMPPGNRPAWTKKEVDLLRKFVTDVDARQRK